MCPVRIQPATATTTKAGETCVSIVRPMNAPTGARCGSPLLHLFHAYTILGMERIEAETRWTASSTEVDSPKSPGRTDDTTSPRAHVPPACDFSQPSVLSIGAR